MSVSQVKKRIAELREYLNRDKEGIKRLDLVKDEVTELRKSLAAANEATQLAVTIKDAARERADAAEATASQLQLDNHSLRQQVASLMRDLDTVTRVEDPVEKIKQTRDDEESEIRAVIKTLKKRVGDCPRSKLLEPSDVSRLLMFDRESIVAGWSHTNLWSLGAAVALLTTLMGKVVISSKNRVPPVTAVEHCKSMLSRNLLDWYGPNNLYANEDLSDMMYDSIIAGNQRRLKEEGSR